VAFQYITSPYERTAEQVIYLAALHAAAPALAAAYALAQDFALML
jgi:hypothetical protein